MNRISAVCAASCFLLLTHAAFGADQVEPNPNVRPAGHMSAGLLSLRLEIRDAVWNPEGENGPQIPVQVFAEEGQPASNPGPLIRVVVGARVRVSLHNGLTSETVTVHGLDPHSSVAGDPITIPPLGTSNVEFQTVRPGVYFYWGTTTGSTLDKRYGVDSQLSGAF